MAEELLNQTDAQGRRQGPWEEKTEWGDTWKGLYVDGLRQEIWKRYTKKGVLMEESSYIDGKQDGPWKHYRPNGNGMLWMEGHYLNGEQHGLWKEYWEETTIRRILYHKGKRVSYSDMLNFLDWLNFI